jgi:hypothetical protein
LEIGAVQGTVFAGILVYIFTHAAAEAALLRTDHVGAELDLVVVLFTEDEFHHPIVDVEPLEAALAVFLDDT